MTTTNLKKLRKEWYAKLKAEGFSDIEQADGNIKTWSSKLNQRYRTNLGDLAAKTEYYYLANHFLTEHIFETELQRIIWEYHANAISYRKIGKLLKAAGLKFGYRNGVYLVIKELKLIMFKRYGVTNK